MKLTLNSKDFERIKTKSSYNHNYYKYTGREANYPLVIYEVCHEDYNYYSYYLVEDFNKIFLGCSYDHIHDLAIVNIDFKTYYT